MEVIGYICSLLIGVSLGLIGSGGSILAIPILVYFFALTPEHATTHSLFIVGITSAIAVRKHYRFGNLKIREALYFVVPSIISLLVSRKYLLPAVPEVIFDRGFIVTKHLVMMVLFALLMMGASFSMIRKPIPPTAPGHISVSRLVLLGLLIGVVTGFLGAGGGFLIVPVLVFYAGMRLRHAIATSLLIITVNSLSGFIGDLVNHVVFDKQILVTVSATAIAGMFGGLYLSNRIDTHKLKPIFGWFVFLMGLFILAKELFFSR
ncbi:sulfite exporter TauE/SafE family protein [Niabella sp. CC-SYL272]|uniref:sulfite exporter TauE/SafE family protein n=1 Tax=Niabella agricola TaxID=2891571 RepID=UPI001F32A1C3|nr:sulfite exporter TauE/SafE family protein [Niabella agricola]MCF3111413.1 sulfite exporter TauE/SafE family protein [Niabella agricola]